MRTLTGQTTPRRPTALRGQAATHPSNTQVVGPPDGAAPRRRRAKLNRAPSQITTSPGTTPRVTRVFNLVFAA
jgi:hypothetical protein